MELKQIIPTKICLSCDVCCRFLDRKSQWLPLFLPHEITRKIKPYLTRSGRIKPLACNNMYICPFFNKENHKCSIYSLRPFDCQLYPFTITFDEEHKTIVLGMDTKCLFIIEPKNQAIIKKYSGYLADTLEQKHIASVISRNPLFIGSFHSDIIKLSTLSILTKLLINNPEKNGFKKLSLKDKGKFSNQEFINLYIWKDINPVWYKKEKGKMKIILENDAGYIDFGSVKKFPDYIYLQKDLAELKGKKYRHKRAAYNHFVKNYKFQYIPYKESMKNECLNLFSKWANQRKQKSNDLYYRQLLYDSSFAHKTSLENYRALGLIGRVIKIKGKIRAYTFGFKLTKDMFCILLEVCDLKFKGISEFIFREFCREMSRYKYINTMDDSGLENLQLAKLSYYPILSS
jgi:Fe-S-cluster containining protein